MPPSSPRFEPYSSCSQAVSATYLSSLRSNRPVRPTGSRPLPSKPSITNLEDESIPERVGSALSFRHGDDGTGQDALKRMSVPTTTSQTNYGSLRGIPLVQAPSTRRVTPPEATYKESSTRQKEKQEAHSLRCALEKIDRKDLDGDESRIYSAAQMEAADLVWKHRNPQLAEHEKTAPYRNPDLAVAKKKYVILDDGSALDQHSRRNSQFADEYDNGQLASLRLAKRGSRDRMNSHASAETRNNGRRRSSGTRQISSGSSKGVFRNPEDQIYEEPGEIETTTRFAAMEDLPLRSRTRNSLPRGSRPLPEKPGRVNLTETPQLGRQDDQGTTLKQSGHTEHSTVDQLQQTETPELVETPKGRAMEIRSDEIRAATSMKRKDRSPKLPTPTAVSDKPGRPIVSFDPNWRPNEDRSKSEREMGRPASRPLPSITTSPRGSIETSRHSPRPMPALPAAESSNAVIPAISLPDDVRTPPKNNNTKPRALPQIDVPNEQSSIPSISISTTPSIPSINVQDDTDSSSSVPTISVSDAPAPSQNMPHTNIAADNKSTRPLPTINVGSTQSPKARPLPPIQPHSSTIRASPNTSSQGSNSRVPWLSRGSSTPTIAGNRPTTVSCAACALPVTGRIVTAGGTSNRKARFHPECFTCYHCSTPLECVSFYPEPEASREERLQQSSSPTGIDDLRFYCHLDYHELFSPKCASCRTPIEGRVILAVGKSYHEGHFFCAECGDPFSSSDPFVENKGYAYCVSCHTKRTSARCKGCKKQILDEVSVEALGGKWHEECFVCDECGGGFGEEGRFFVREVELELTEKEKRKGLSVGEKIEERAVCQECEEKRLKGWDVHAFL